MRAGAKTNLFLEVPAKRPDGFHELDTVFAELELADELTVERCEGLELNVDGGGPEVPEGEENLVWRAAAAMRDFREPWPGATITLRKVIPTGGGLGGGSSDAAAALVALNDLWHTGLDPDTLEELAARLGSDVAFFVRGGLQRGRGRGEILEPLPLPRLPLELLLLFPSFGCPTPAVYDALAEFLPETPRTAEPLIEALATGDVAAIGAQLFNRLEAPAFKLFPELERLKSDLAARPGVVATLLSGSGSTLLALMESREANEREASSLAASGASCLATRTVADTE